MGNLLIKLNLAEERAKNKGLDTLSGLKEVEKIGEKRKSRLSGNPDC